MCGRVKSRVAFGKTLAEQGMIRLADSPDEVHAEAVANLELKKGR
jgi:hypothetical protein